MSKEKYDDLTADEIFAIQDTDIEVLNIKQWKGRVYMRNFTGRERTTMTAKIQATNEKSADQNLALILWVFVHGVCDSKGERLFGDDKDTLNKLKDKQGAVLEGAAKAIMEFNAVSDIQEKVEEEAKNS